MWHARRGGPETPLRTTFANLDCEFVKNALFLLFQVLGAPFMNPLGVAENMESLRESVCVTTPSVIDTPLCCFAYNNITTGH